MAAAAARHGIESRLSLLPLPGRRPSPEPARAQADGGEPVAVTLLEATPLIACQSRQGDREELGCNLPSEASRVATAVVVEA